VNITILFSVLQKKKFPQKNKKKIFALKDDIMSILSGFHRNENLTKEINCTFIALIAKVESPQRLTDLRPISLVECLYKVLYKVFVANNREV